MPGVSSGLHMTVMGSHPAGVMPSCTIACRCALTEHVLLHVRPSRMSCAHKSSAARSAARDASGPGTHHIQNVLLPGQCTGDITSQVHLRPQAS
jgi:hypothetical protein